MTDDELHPLDDLGVKDLRLCEDEVRDRGTLLFLMDAERVVVLDEAVPDADVVQDGGKLNDSLGIVVCLLQMRSSSRCSRR